MLPGVLLESAKRLHPREGLQPAPQQLAGGWGGMAGVKRVSDRARIRNQVPPNPGVRWFQLENNQEDVKKQRGKVLQLKWSKGKQDTKWWGLYDSSTYG